MIPKGSFCCFLATRVLCPGGLFLWEGINKALWHIFYNQNSFLAGVTYFFSLKRHLFLIVVPLWHNFYAKGGIYAEKKAFIRVFAIFNSPGNGAILLLGSLAKIRHRRKGGSNVQNDRADAIHENLHEILKEFQGNYFRFIDSSRSISQNRLQSSSLGLAPLYYFSPIERGGRALK